MKIISRPIFEKYTNIKFHKKPSSGGPNCSMRNNGRRDGWTGRQTDVIMMLIVAFGNFAKASKNYSLSRPGRASDPVHLLTE